VFLWSKKNSFLKRKKNSKKNENSREKIREKRINKKKDSLILMKIKK